MIALALLRPFLPIVGGALLIGGAWWWHENAVDNAFERGQESMRAQVLERDRIAAADARGRSTALARSAILGTEKLHDTIATLERRSAARGAESRSLQQRLAELAARPVAGGNTCPAERNYAAEFRSCAGLLGESIGLVAEGEDLLGLAEARLDSLQGWARLVQQGAQP